MNLYYNTYWFINENGDMRTYTKYKIAIKDIKYMNNKGFYFFIKDGGNYWKNLPKIEILEDGTIQVFKMNWGTKKNIILKDLKKFIQKEKEKKN